MIKIISISNAHAWDSTTITKEQFDKLCDVLTFSGFIHNLKYEYAGSVYLMGIGEVK